MIQKIVECIPNFSEGRNSEVINAIESAIAAIAGVHILDLHSDEDHNRSVITFIGSPEAVTQAAFSAIEIAAELIDLDKHQGEHPRIGATDVVPFVPISGVTMEECVELAKSLGKRVGDELGIPVYLYENAATRPDRKNLEKIRKGEYEKLRESIQDDPDRTPDFGPSRMGTAGATVIGARPPFIAYNVYLTTDDVSIAKNIARSVRQSSGGLPHVKALGMLVEGKAQVSMNLTDHTQTPIAQVVEAIRREAEDFGVSIHHSELVGLIPQAALVDAAQWYLQLDPFESGQILETRMYTALSQEPSFVEKLSAGTPTPGGGSAAAYAGAMAAALAAMVARLTIGKKKYAQVEDRMSEIIDRADEIRSSLEGAVILDAQAFDAVMRAYRMPKGSAVEEQARVEAIEKATINAAIVPLHVARHAADVLEIAIEVAESGNINAITDAGAAGLLARASFSAAILNVEINAREISDEKLTKGWLEEIQELREKIRTSETGLSKTLGERAGLDL
ncbi:MAG: glutamate formimidoyltransferase [Anaerolineaceae bacterium]|nr:MAG: glutamate formimidoyltransferase [Anaerolineaceae bacterium]